MRLRTLYFIAAFAATAIPRSAGAQSLPANHQWTTHAQAHNLAVRQCHPGYDWEPAGYLGAALGAMRVAQSNNRLLTQ